MNKLGKTAGRFPPGPAGGWGGGPGPGGQPPPQPPQREPRIPGGRSSPVRPKRVQKQNPLNTGGPSAASRLPSKPSSGERARLAASGRAAGRVGELGEVRPPLAVHALHAVVLVGRRDGDHLRRELLVEIPGVRLGRDLRLERWAELRKGGLGYRPGPARTTARRELCPWLGK